MSYLRKLASARQGQSSIMMAIMMLTFLFLFCFVVNLGMLVNAKINLQNAADLAAYAGAAVQARQMNEISYLNYEMREEYKKFLFRYYVMGNMAQAQFPQQSSPNGGSTPYKWSPDGTMNLGVPVVCMIFKASDDYCKLSQLPPISAPPPSPFDPINQTLISALQGFEQIRQGNCAAISVTNLLALQLWLYNTDPTLQSLQQKGFSSSDPQTNQDFNEAVQILTYVADGLGLVPEELLLLSRINTLGGPIEGSSGNPGYLNEPSHELSTMDDVNALKAKQDPERYERAIQAFLSAYYTLGNHIFGNSIQFQELLPSSIFSLKSVNVNFDTYAIHYTSNLNASVAIGNNPAGTSSCQAQVADVSLTQPLTVAVEKDPSILTYYAVRLKATAKLLFSPWSNVQLTAYSAARPFGSRLGPQYLVNQDPGWLWVGASPAVNDASGTASIDKAGAIPNLPITANDTTTGGGGWSTQEALGTLFQAAFPGSGSVGSGVGAVLQAQDVHRAYQIAMAPNPWEGSRYNVPYDSAAAAQDFSPNFDGVKLMTFWAPIFPPDSSGDVSSLLQNELDNIMPAQTPQAQELKSNLKQALSQYINLLQSGSSNTQENFETVNLARLPDPNFIRSDQPTQPPTPLQSSGLPAWILMQDPKDYYTSWNHPNDAIARMTFPGQIGYSVKFVAFNTLLSGQTPTTPQGTSLSNGLKGLDEELDTDIGSLQH